MRLGIPRPRCGMLHKPPSLRRSRRLAAPVLRLAAAPPVGRGRTPQGEVRPPLGDRRPGGPLAGPAALLPLLRHTGVPRLLLPGRSQRDLPRGPAHGGAGEALFALRREPRGSAEEAEALLID